MQDGTDSAEDPGNAATAAGAAAGLRAGEDSLATVQAIAKWCDDAHDRTLRTARWQLSYVWILVLLGMLALLFLPVVVEFIDTRLRGQTLPKAVVDDANAAVEKLELNYASLREEAEGLQATFSELEAQIRGLQTQRRDLAERIDATMREPFAVWERTQGPIERSGALAVTADGRYLLGGMAGGGAAIFFSTDGMVWQQADLALGDGRDPADAIITRILQTEDGALYALASAALNDGPLIFRSDDGLVWQRQAIKGSPLLRNSVFLVDLAAGSDGHLIGVGSMPSPTAPAPAIVSIDPDGWEMVLLWQPPGLTIGEMTAIHRTPSGELIAAGYHESSGGVTTGVIAVQSPTPEQNADLPDAWRVRRLSLDIGDTVLRHVGALNGELWTAGGSGPIGFQRPALWRGDPMVNPQRLLPRSRAERPFQMEMRDLAGFADGTLVAVGIPGGSPDDPDRRGQNLVWSRDGETWSGMFLGARTSLDGTSRNLFQVMALDQARALLTEGFGPPFLTVDGLHLERIIAEAIPGGYPLSPALAADAAARQRNASAAERGALRPSRAPPPPSRRPLPRVDDLLMPAEVHEDRDEIRALLTQIRDLETQLESQGALVSSASVTPSSIGRSLPAARSAAWAAS
ncbi:MAG: hypothetical protein AAFV96_08500, partial [Pseudomonadota bacterium]